MLSAKFNLIIFLITFSSISVLAQEKFEKEYRASEDDIPTAALQFLENVEFDKRVKWFKEESQDGISYEAKSKIRSQKISIEFDTTGRLQDIEITIPEAEIPSETLSTIKTYLDESYTKSKIEKIQKQWTGNPKVLNRMLVSGNENEDHILSYEIMASTRDSGAYVLYEYLFNDQGKVVRKSRVKPRHTDNLDF